ncbi:MAG: pyridoxamine 5'-phosphate oxidase family protein [Alphaproteobacteria bacterium]|nr:pyridoxamine 5'-phosphate oxidase family protein [Alphaproteobacteria bacterium]
METSPFHIDERMAQSLAHQSVGSAPIRSFMPDQHRQFFALLPYLFVATTDARDWPVASVLPGVPGFVASPNPTHLRVTARLPADDPATAGFGEGRPVGLLGIDLATRRRNRANGTIESLDAAGFTVAVDQSFGNCPQYIQTRQAEPHARAASPVQAFTGLDDAARELIARADTFFVASRSRPTIGHGAGLDMSHRGGRPGFVSVAGDTLTIPDFRGNRYFNTLGNLLGDPRASLLFVDFASGELLQLQGIASIDWTDRAAGQIEGAQRSWSVRVERGWRRRDFPFNWRFGDYAPTTLATGNWRTSP